MDKSLLFGGKVVPASDGSGDYLVGDEAIWLLRGSEAVRVKEVEMFSASNPATRPARRVANIEVNVDDSDTTDFGLYDDGTAREY